ncbi:hypothetical protein ACHWQZ_G014921 [Mnemiopsis leidyi]
MKDESSQCILNNFQLENLRRHVYKSTGKTVLDPYMQVFWCWLVERVPLCIAPNMITLVGLLVNIGTTLVLVYYSSDGHSTAPPGAFIACGLGLFIYQSLDAIDGKHARRTGTNNPLGELFDHGCDAFSTVFVIIAYGIATDLGPSYWFFYLCCVCNFMFYAAHWQTLVSGSLHFGQFDVTEAQIFLIGTQLWTGCFGAALWNIELVEGFQIKHAMLCLSTVCSCASFILSGNVATILTGGIGKNGATIADTSVLSPCIPILLLTGMFYKILAESDTLLYQENTILFLLTMGLAFTKVTNSLVVAHMTKSPPTLVVDSIMLGPALMLINQYLSAPVPEQFLLWLVMLFTAYDSIRYCVEICKEICAGLNIPCLTMPEGVKLVSTPLPAKRASLRPSRSSDLDSSPKRHSMRSAYSVGDVRKTIRTSSVSRIGRLPRRATDSGSGTSMSDKN